jgi:hypothetical protein
MADGRVRRAVSRRKVERRRRVRHWMVLSVATVTPREFDRVEVELDAVAGVVIDMAQARGSVAEVDSTTSSARHRAGEVLPKGSRSASVAHVSVKKWCCRRGRGRVANVGEGADWQEWQGSRRGLPIGLAAAIESDAHLRFQVFAAAEQGNLLCRSLQPTQVPTTFRPAIVMPAPQCEDNAHAVFMVHIG